MLTYDFIMSSVNMQPIYVNMQHMYIDKGDNYVDM